MFGDYDLGDGLGLQRNCSRWRGDFVCPCAGPCGHLRDIQDDVGGTDVGDGVLLLATSWTGGLVTGRRRNGYRG